jgi:hypothetical protein
MIQKGLVSSLYTLLFLNLSPYRVVGTTNKVRKEGRGHATNGDKSDAAPTTSIEDEGEVGLLKKQYGSKVSTIKEKFPGWTDEDVVFRLQEGKKGE